MGLAKAAIPCMIDLRRSTPHRDPTITTYYNGVPYLTDDYGPYVTSPDTAPEPFNQPFFLAFTSAFSLDGSDTFEPGTTPLPDTMKIDCVRVWQC
jgi:hypothetical protein